MLIIGIDPGITGAICFFEDRKIIDLIEMPNMASGKKNKRQVNGAQVYNEILERIKRPMACHIFKGLAFNTSGRIAFQRSITSEHKRTTAKSQANQASVAHFAPVSICLEW